MFSACRKLSLPQLTSLFATMALLLPMVVRRVSCSTLPLWRPLSLCPPNSVLSLASHLGLSHASSTGACLQPQSIVFLSSTQASCSSSRETPTSGSDFSSSDVDNMLMHLECHLCRRSILWYFGTLLIFLLTVVVPLWTSFFPRFLS